MFFHKVQYGLKMHNSSSKKKMEEFTVRYTAQVGKSSTYFYSVNEFNSGYLLGWLRIQVTDLTYTNLRNKCIGLRYRIFHASVTFFRQAWYWDTDNANKIQSSNFSARPHWLPPFSGWLISKWPKFLFILFICVSPVPKLATW